MEPFRSPGQIPAGDSLDEEFGPDDDEVALDQYELEPHRGSLRFSWALFGTAFLGVVLALIWHSIDRQQWSADQLVPSFTAQGTGTANTTPSAEQVTELDTLKKTIAELRASQQQMAATIAALQADQQQLQQWSSLKSAYWYSEPNMLMRHIVTAQPRQKSTVIEPRSEMQDANSARPPSAWSHDRLLNCLGQVFRYDYFICRSGAALPRQSARSPRDRLSSTSSWSTQWAAVAALAGDRRPFIPTIRGGDLIDEAAIGYGFARFRIVWLPIRHTFARAALGARRIARRPARWRCASGCPPEKVVVVPRNPARRLFRGRCAGFPRHCRCHRSSATAWPAARSSLAAWAAAAGQGLRRPDSRSAIGDRARVPTPRC